jgi:membrane peptidoglycan carboxypeptidase
LVTRIPDGPSEVEQAAIDAGLTPNDSWQLHNRIALGQAEVSPLQQANGYATIANDGRRATVHVIAEVRAANGQVKYTGPTATQQTIDPLVTHDAIYAMQSVVNGGFAAGFAQGHPAAGKTGTAEVGIETKAAWFTGYTTKVSTAVMFVAGDDGYGDLNPYRLPGWGGFTGSSYPTLVWVDYMKTVAANDPYEAFPPPAHLNGTGNERDPLPDPSASPSVSATPSVSASPSTEPSASPSVTPSEEPTVEPSTTPGLPPSTEPTEGG